MEGKGIVIKKETMIKKNTHEIAEIYDLEKQVNIYHDEIKNRNLAVDHMGQFIRQFIRQQDKKEPLRLQQKVKSRTWIGLELKLRSCKLWY